tara:strand:+ start:3759 stop:4010 length:252 start_codon:yes stop_codon:yes gene_type:complete
MEITKLSTKGQIVIPENLRESFEVGTSFMVSKQGNLIVLKKMNGLTKAEIDEMKELDKIWKEIDDGKCDSYSVDEFFNAMKKW